MARPRIPQNNPFLLCVLAAALSCSDGSKIPFDVPPADTDTDIDADTDVDTDADTDTDVDVTAGNTTSLCAGGGYAENGETTGILCTSPLAVGTSSATNGTMTLYAGPVYRSAP